MTKSGITEIFACLLVSVGITLGCVDPEDGGGNTGGTSLYVFDTSDYASSRILVYSDVSALFDDSAIQPSRRLSGSKIDRVKNLAWGGMCLDATGNRLYLVSESGDVVRIDRIRAQNGDISSPIDIVSFKLGASDSDRLSNGKFGQISINPRGSMLYITEANSSDTRIWVLTNPESQRDGSTVSGGGQLFESGDKGGTSVAAANDGSVYAYFDDGNSPFVQGVSYAGPRLRKGTSSEFQNMIIGSTSDNRTRLAKYGCLAVDNTNNIYLARHLVDSSLNSGDALLIFKAGQFSPGLNQAPDKSFSPSINNLRVISHAVTKDWLVGALSNGDLGTDSVWIWKTPSMASKECRLGSNASIRGLALDGKN